MELEQYFRGYAAINLDAIEENILAMKKELKDSTEIVAVIKTDGYGHGAVPIAKKINHLCYGYAVATAYEGHNLRLHGIDKPIFLLGYTPICTLEMVIREDIIPAVFTYDFAKEISEKAKKLKKNVKINIAVDTGMGRIGFCPSHESACEIKKISELENIEIESIFTHFAKADYKDKTNAQNQLKEYMSFVKMLEEMSVKIPIHQCANSAAMMEMPETSLDISRAGIAMYGLYPSEEMNKKHIELKPALSLYSHIVYVKTVEAGTGISYGQTFVTDKKMKIATIPIGYGDGYPRNLSNKGYVLIHGKKAKILGRVCMDQFMVDVTDIDAKEGDLVTLIGTDGDETILLDEIALMAGTFNYEFACDLGKRIPRVYFSDGKIVGTKDYYEDKYKINL